MEVYEVMLFAIPLWFGLVGFLFTLVFGKDILVYFMSKGARIDSAVRAKQPDAKTSEGWHEPQPYENRSRKDTRELVLK